MITDLDKKIMDFEDRLEDAYRGYLYGKNLNTLSPKLVFRTPQPKSLKDVCYKVEALPVSLVGGTDVDTVCAFCADVLAMMCSLNDEPTEYIDTWISYLNDYLLKYRNGNKYGKV